LQDHFAEISKKWRLDPCSYITQHDIFKFLGKHKPFKYYQENIKLLLHQDVLIENNEFMNYFFRYHFFMDELKNLYEKLQR
jgi:hypothetical protein